MGVIISLYPHIPCNKKKLKQLSERFPGTKHERNLIYKQLIKENHDRRTIK